MVAWDVLVNNAGVPTHVPIEDITLKYWQEVLDVNLTAAFLCSREAIKIMKSQTPQGGRIINIGSVSAKTPRPDSLPCTADFSAKCLQLLIETVPTLSGVGVLWDPTTGALQLKAVETAAQGFGIIVQVFEARRAAEIAEAFYALDRSRFQGLLLLSSPLIAGNPQLIADLAIRRNLPTISLFPEIARAGGLIGYGPVIQDLFRQVGGMARKVLQGAKVAELPVERPTRFQLVANLKTAKLIGITLPAPILLRADEVIE